MTWIIVLDVCKSMCVYGTIRLNYNRKVITHGKKRKSAAEEALCYHNKAVCPKRTALLFMRYLNENIKYVEGGAFQSVRTALHWNEPLPLCLVKFTSAFLKVFCFLKIVQILVLYIILSLFLLGSTEISAKLRTRFSLLTGLCLVPVCQYNEAFS